MGTQVSTLNRSQSDLYVCLIDYSFCSRPARFISLLLHVDYFKSTGTKKLTNLVLARRISWPHLREPLIKDAAVCVCSWEPDFWIQSHLGFLLELAQCWAEESSGWNESAPRAAENQPTNQPIPPYFFISFTTSLTTTSLINLFFSILVVVMKHYSISWKKAKNK